MPSHCLGDWRKDFYSSHVLYCLVDKSTTGAVGEVQKRRYLTFMRPYTMKATIATPFIWYPSSPIANWFPHLSSLLFKNCMTNANMRNAGDFSQ